MADLETDLAAAQVAQLTVGARVAESEQRIDVLEDQLDAARVEIAEAEQANALLAADRDQQLQQATAYQTALETLRNQTDWLAQVAGYHIGYAGKPREVEVKVDGDDQEAIREAALELSSWLSKELDSSIRIPLGLPMEGGLDFVGGRMLPITGGIPVGQIAYHDDQGRLTAFCMKRNPTGRVQGLERRQFFDRLQMIHWQDEDFQYVVVGFAEFEALQPVADWLQENYGEDT
jgi:anti-sigma factor RsiW